MTITQNHQKIELYGSLITRELKKPHSSRLVEGTEGWRPGDTEPAVPEPTCGGYKMEGYLGSEGSHLPHQTNQTRAPVPGR